MAAPVTMDEEEKMLGGLDDRELEAKKVEILNSQSNLMLARLIECLGENSLNVQKAEDERSGNIAVVVAAVSMVLLAFAVVGLKVSQILIFIW